MNADKTTRSASSPSAPMLDTLTGSRSRRARAQAAPLVAPLAGQDSLNGHRTGGTHSTPAVEGTASPQATRPPAPKRPAPAGNQAIPGGHTDHGTQRIIATGDHQLPPASATGRTAPIHAAPLLADPILTLAADVLDDLEKVRVANENRLRQLTRSETDSDGEIRGFGLDESHPDVARLSALVGMLGKAEHQATLNLERLMRQHPLGPWVQAHRGIGEKQAARLLATIGDPYWNTLYDRPRLVSELWAYCGYGDSRTQVRRRGQKANWDSTARMRAYLVAASCVKQPPGSRYRDVYDAARAKYADAVHVAECVRCGPSGKPAQAGSPLSAGHQHARALRAVAKEVLRDLWREARRLHISR